MLKARKKKWRKKIKMDLCVCLEFLPGEPEKNVEFYVGEKKTAREVLELALTPEQLEEGYYLIEDNEGKLLEELSYDKDIVWVRLDRTRKKPKLKKEDTFAVKQKANVRRKYEPTGAPYVEDSDNGDLKEDEKSNELLIKGKSPGKRRNSEKKYRNFNPRSPEERGSFGVNAFEYNDIERSCDEMRASSRSPRRKTSSCAVPYDYNEVEQRNDETGRSPTSQFSLWGQDDPWSQWLHIFGIITTITGAGLTLTRNDTVSACIFVIGLCFFTVTLFNNKTFSYLKNARSTNEGISGYINHLREVRPLLKWSIHSYHMATENTSKRHKRRIKQITHKAVKFWIPKEFENGGDDLFSLKEIERSANSSELLQLNLSKSFKFLDEASERMYIETLRRFRAHHNRDNKLAFTCELLIDGFEPLTLFHPKGSSESTRWVGLWSYFLASFCCLSIPYRIWFHRRARRIDFSIVKYIGEITDEDFTPIISDDKSIKSRTKLLSKDLNKPAMPDKEGRSSFKTGGPVRRRSLDSNQTFLKSEKTRQTSKKNIILKNVIDHSHLPVGLCDGIRQKTRSRTESTMKYMCNEKSQQLSKMQPYSIYNQKVKADIFELE